MVQAFRTRMAPPVHCLGLSVGNLEVIYSKPLTDHGL